MSEADFVLQEVSRSLDLYYAMCIWKPDEMVVKIRDILNKYFTEVDDENRG